jgi:uncharacterized damage-inducible protein DinB
MADAAHLKKLVAYNEWADAKILKAIDGMTPADLAKPVESYFGSLARNVQHVLAAQRVWLARWKGDPPPKLDAPITEPWREAYAATHVALRAFVEPLGNADFDRAVSYRDTRGNPYELPLFQLVTHLVNHGTAHRAETGLLLERIGRSPGDLDFLYFCLGR